MKSFLIAAMLALNVITSPVAAQQRQPVRQAPHYPFYMPPSPYYAPVPRPVYAPSPAYGYQYNYQYRFYYVPYGTGFPHQNPGYYPSWWRR